MPSWITEQQLLLSQQISNNTLPHALVITGVEKSGKALLAQWLVEVLACQQLSESNGVLVACQQCKCCQLLQSASYPDHLYLRLEGNTIGVDQVRQASRFFEKTALLGGVQTAVIEAADKMTESAANALLKTLEEPTANSIILLLTAEAERLLPTIISRCRRIELRVTPQNNGVLSHRDLGENFALFFQCYCNYLVGVESRVALLELLVDNEQALKWLEFATADLLRQQSNWSSLVNTVTLDQQVAEKLKLISHEELWQLNRLVNKMSRQIHTISQMNKNFHFEKLLVEMSQVITPKVT